MIAFTDLFKAMQLGNELKDPKKWKNVQMTTTLIGGAIALAMKYLAPDFNLDQETMDTLATGLAFLLAAGNVILVKATSKKV